jgi:membrane dipeptidase
MDNATEPDTHPFTLDGHIDAIYYALAHGGADAFFTADATAQASLAGLRAGGVDAAFFALFGQGEQPEAGDLAACVAETDQLMDHYADWVAPGAPMRAIRTSRDLEELAAAAPGPRPFGVIIHIEGTRGIRDLDHLHRLHDRGLRSVGLTWNYRNPYAAGALESPDEGLTAAGRDLVRELEALHMVIDAAHLNRQGFADLLDTARGPVVVTHTACAALFPHPRCMTDDQIRAVAERGGVIGIFFANKFLAPAGARVTIDTVIDHYDHLIGVAGIEHVALGTDFGGIDSGLPENLTIPAVLPAFFARLAERGYTAADIAALRGGNYRRVLGRILG